MGRDQSDLDRAFSVETPDDNRRLYADWATDYDDGFLATHGYVHHESVANAFVGRDRPAGPVLDVGCGTGVVGVALRGLGVDPVDGIDLSPEMLDVAAAKHAPDGASTYRQLMAADLTEPVEFPDATYAGIVSAGAFTHGHLGPEPLAELVRIAVPGAVFAIGINAGHYEGAGFARWFDRSQTQGLIESFQVVTAPIYDETRYVASDAADHAATLSSVATFVRS